MTDRINLHCQNVHYIELEMNWKDTGKQKGLKIKRETKKELELNKRGSEILENNWKTNALSAFYKFRTYNRTHWKDTGKQIGTRKN